MSNRTASKSAPKKCLVTGASGFLGARLISKLERLGYKTFKGDRKGSVPKVDWVFDCATYGNHHWQTDLDEIVNANVLRTRDLLINAEKKGVKAVILVSTSSVTQFPQTAYSAGKVLAEHYGLLASFNGVPTVTLRPYTLYGPGDKGHLIDKVFDSCLKGTFMELDPEATHDYLYIDDFINEMISSAQDIKHDQGKIFEIGWGTAVSNELVVRLIEQITGRKANYNIVRRMRAYDNPNWYYKGPPLKLKVDLVEGLSRIYEELKDQKTYH